MTTITPDQQPGSGPVVVAYDDSHEARQALDWAAKRAEEQNAALRIVHAFHVPSGPESAGAFLRRDTDARAEAKELVGRAERAVLDNYPQLEVEAIAKVGRTTQVLKWHAEDASMLVVATRKRSRIAQWLTGSVTNRLTGRVGCPVMSLTPDSARDFASA